MQRTGATVTYLLGAMVPMLLGRAPSPDERSHRVRVALAPGVPAHLHDVFFDAHRHPLRRRLRLDGDQFRHRRSAPANVCADRMGRVAPGIAARVVDESGRECADGTAGELTLKADEPLAFSSGYFAAPDKTAEAWRDGWFHTGDRVVRHADGTFAFVDRLKDVHPAARREHLIVRGRAGAVGASRRRGRGRVSGTLAARGGRGDGGGRAQSGHAVLPADLAAHCAQRCRVSPCRATSYFWRSCRARRTARCRSSRCARAASRPTPGIGTRNEGQPPCRRQRVGRFGSCAAPPPHRPLIVMLSAPGRSRSRPFESRISVAFRTRRPLVG